jgi:hypothetical protein
VVARVEGGEAIACDGPQGRPEAVTASSQLGAKEDGIAQPQLRAE